jgi:Transcription-repair coupling factor (superfamily II helicase)
MATPKAFGVAQQQQAQPQEVLVLEFADEAKLYVPLEQAYLVSRYVGAGKKSPPLSSLGDGKWARAKSKPRHPFSIMQAKCSRSRRSDKCSPATRLRRTQNGRPNLNVHSRSAKRRTK